MAPTLFIYWPQTGSSKANGRKPKSCLGRVFNFKLGCFIKCVQLMACTNTTEPRFCPVSLSLSRHQSFTRTSYWARTLSTVGRPSRNRWSSGSEVGGFGAAPPSSKKWQIERFQNMEPSLQISNERKSAAGFCWKVAALCSQKCFATFILGKITEMLISQQPSKLEKK